MIEKLKEFIIENLGIILGIGFVQMILLGPHVGKMFFSITAYIPLLINFFPFPFNWFLGVFVITQVIKVGISIIKTIIPKII